jgi:hypothetical protein
VDVVVLPPGSVLDVVELEAVVGAAVGGVVGGDVGGSVGGITMTVGGLVGAAVGGIVTGGRVVVVLVDVELVLEVDELLVDVRSGTCTLVVSSPPSPLETANAMPTSTSTPAIAAPPIVRARFSSGSIGSATRKRY